MARQINIVSGSISIDEKSTFWVGSLVLGSIEDYLKFSINDVFVLDMLGELYHLRVDGLNKDHSFGQVNYTVSFVSIGAKYRVPDAKKITKDYYQNNSGIVVAGNASTICNALLVDAQPLPITSVVVSSSSVDTVIYDHYEDHREGGVNHYYTVPNEGQIKKQTSTALTVIQTTTYSDGTPPEVLTLWAGQGITTEYVSTLVSDGYPQGQQVGSTVLSIATNIPSWSSPTVSLTSTITTVTGAPRTETVTWCTVDQDEAIPVIAWNMVDWSIPPGKVSAVRSPALDIIKPIVQAAGGVLESLPSGKLIARPLYPVSIQDYETATPDQIFTEEDDLFTYSETFEKRTLENLLVLRDEPMLGLGSGYLSAEVDNRPAYLGGLNNKTEFFAGDIVWFLVYLGPNVVLDSVECSDGSIVTGQFPVVNGALTVGAEVLAEQEEYVTFTYENEKSVAKPISAIHKFQWLGNDLGTPIIQKPLTSILITVPNDPATPAAKGTAVAYMRYSARAKTFALKSPVAMNNPATMQGLGQYPIHIRVVGTFTPPPIGS